MENQVNSEKPQPQVLGVEGIGSSEGVMNTPTPADKKIDPIVMKKYQAIQRKYMEVYGRYHTRKNWIKKVKLGQRLNELETELSKLEKSLYID
jgi:hypothetical protein